MLLCLVKCLQYKCCFSKVMTLISILIFTYNKKKNSESKKIGNCPK